MMAVVTYTAYALGLSWNITTDTHGQNIENIAGSHIRKSVIELWAKSSNIFGCRVQLLFCSDYPCCMPLPITFLKSPQDFWWAVVIAMITTSCAVVLIIVGASLDYGLCSGYTGMPSYQPKNFFLALGTLLFAYGGHSAFPHYST
ncbi:hypothetical protein OSTOST_20663 [Ostertagia ostertagi]